MKPLHRHVSLAIWEAERHDADGAKLWDRVAECEKAIVNENSAVYTDLERNIAYNGVRLAEERARVLRREPRPLDDLAAEPCRSRLRYLPDCPCETCAARAELQCLAESQDVDP